MSWVRDRLCAGPSSSRYSRCMDVDLSADANSASWALQADDVVVAHPAAGAFRVACDASLLGTDVVAAKLVHFLGDGYLDSTYSFRAATTDPSKAHADTYTTGTWGPRRFAVETSLGCLGTAVYATLDLPGALGDTTYGPFRIVRPPMPGSRPPIVVPHNSAAAYGATGTCSETELCSDAAQWADRGALATATSGERAAASATADWPALLAREDATSTVESDLIEVIVRDGRTPMADVAAVRVAQADFDVMIDTYLRSLTTGSAATLSEPEMAAVQLAQAQVDGSLTLEVIA